MNNKGRGLVVAIVVLAVICVVFLAAGFMILRTWGGLDWWRDIPNNVKNVEEYSINKTQQTPVQGYDTFEFSSVSADIDVIYADTETITVELKGSYRSGKGEVELKKETSGNRVHIYVDYPKLSGILTWNETYLTITMPMDLEGKELRFNSVSGEVDIPAGLVADEISVHSTSGDVQADDVECRIFEFGNVSGELDLTGYVSEKIKVETVSGDTDLMLYGITEDVSVNGVSGKVTVTLPKDASFSFAYNTVSGDFDCAFPVYTQGGKNDRNGYTDSDADMHMNINTVSGDLNIRN